MISIRICTSCKEEVDKSKRLWKTVLQRNRKIRRTVIQWTLVGDATNWLTYAISRRVIVRYTKLSTIVRYKVGSVKGRPLEKKIPCVNLNGSIYSLVISKSSPLKNICNIFWLRKKITSRLGLTNVFFLFVF
jgi:hypothetical protein